MWVGPQAKNSWMSMRVIRKNEGATSLYTPGLHWHCNSDLDEDKHISDKKKKKSVLKLL